MTQAVVRSLLVEDNPGDARLVLEALREVPEFRFELVGASSLAEALELAGRGDIDVVLLDLGLPDSVGLETLERFCAALPHVPLVALTGLDDVDTAVAAVKAGAQDYLVKGQISGPLLARAARYAVERHRLHTRVEGLHQETARRLRRLSSLRAIDLAITSSFDMRLTLSLILDHVIDELAVDAASILLLDGATQELEFAQGRGLATAAADHPRLRLGDGHAGKVALDRRVVVVPDLENSGASSNEVCASEGFASYVGAPLVAKGQVKGVLQVCSRSRFEPDPEWLDFFETLAGQAAIAVDSSQLFEDLQRSNLELSLAYDTTLEGWSRALDLRDKETEGHSQRVTEMTVQLARRMGLSEHEVLLARRGALLHDIGKMGIPDRILLKPGPLTDEEWDVMRQHPKYAYDLLWPIAYLRPALAIPYCHHEKWDGTGYPRRLAGEEIPLAARLFAIADVWDAVSSDRPYRPAWPADKVTAHILGESGKHFDPRVVRVFQQIRGSSGPARADRAAIP